MQAVGPGDSDQAVNEDLVTAQIADNVKREIEPENQREPTSELDGSVLV